MKTGTPRAQLSCVSAILGLFCLPWAVHGQFQALGTCTGTGASVSTSALEWNAGVVNGIGGWSASGGASGVRLRFSIDGALVQEETRSGTSGSWTFSDDFTQSGTHALTIQACPIVTSGGVSTVCLAHCSTPPQSGFTTWPEVDAGCSLTSAPNLACSASLYVATVAPYTCWWQQGNGSWFSQSCWESNFICKGFTPPYTVSFKVTDAHGKESNVVLAGSCNMLVD